MARKNRSISNVFETLQGNQQKPIKDNKPLKDTDTVNKNTDNKNNEKKKTENKDTNIEKTHSKNDTSSNNFNDFKNSILSKYEKKKKKKTMEETHTRTTFLLRNDLAERLDKLTKNKHGMKTLVLNDAVEAIVNALEDK